MAAITRRSLLVGGAGLALAAAGCDGDRPREGFLGLMEAVNERWQRALFDPRRLAPELPEGETTPDRHFPAYRISAEVPRAPAGWALRIGGLVARPQTLSLEALRRLPRTEYRIRHHCVEGWSAVASWTGVRIAELAALAGADERAAYVEFRSFDEGYWSSWDRESALHPQTILAYGRNGLPLPAEYGAPLRLYAAVKLGYKMVKYVTELNFLPVRTGGYWEDQGYEWYAGV